MGLFDLFSNDTAEEAARQRNQGLQQGYDALSSSYGQGRDALTSGYGQAGDLYAGLGSKFDSMYGSGANAYGDVSGANGVAGLQRGTDNFKNSGQYGVYGVGLTEGLQALNRTHAAAGNLSSGNADTDSIKYAQDQASKAYGSYLSGLQPYLGLQGQGALASTTGQAGAAAGLGQGLNASYMGQGGAANANYTGQGASTAAATMNNYQIGKNQLGAITAGAQLAMGMPPTSLGSIGGGSSGGGGGLFSTFGSGNSGTGDGSWFGQSSLNGAPLG